jgi:hypothetical protein
MEISCRRCHQDVLDECCFCSTCGLPQLMYAADAPAGQAQPEHWDDSVRDAGSVEWKSALRMALMFALPAGVLCSLPAPVGSLGIFWMASAAAWTVMLYVRSQRPAWITTGAGARIGLVTGLLSSWLAFVAGSCALFAQRFLFHQASQLDANWKANVAASQQLTQQWTASLASADAAQTQAAHAQIEAFMLTPTGHAGIAAFGLASNSLFLLVFAIAGGALGARMLARTRRPEL